MITEHVVCGRTGDAGEVLCVGSELECEIYLSENEHELANFEEIVFDTMEVFTSNVTHLH